MNLLTIGHVAKDILPNGYAIGGTVTYASVTALRLGWQPRVLTRIGPDLVLPEIFDQVELLVLPSEATTTFENVYTPSGRVQTVHAVADPIGPQDVPEAWRADSDIVLLGPLVNEVAPSVAAMFDEPLLGIVPQGWMRQWDERGLVSHVPMDCASEVLAHADALMLSVEDVDYDLSLAECYHDMVDVMVLTRSDYGCDVYQGGKIVPVAPRPAKEVDPTGAGDVFSTAFLIRLWETGDPIASARFANAMASFSIEGLAYHAIPTREQVEIWLTEND